MAIITREEELRQVLRTHRTIAGLGAHAGPTRAAHYVLEYLTDKGYRVLPVNPHFAGETLFGETTVASLGDLEEPVDMVVVFRRPDAVREHVPEILAMDPRPKTVWLQLGIRNDAAAKALASEGLDVVQNRCTMADHRAWGIGRPDGAPEVEEDD